METKTISLIQASTIRNRLRASCLASLLAVSGTAFSATITVNSFEDQINIDDPATCTLREAIQAANTDATFDGCSAGNGKDTIILPAGTYQLDLVNGTNEDLNADGDLDIRTDMEFRGAGAEFTIIDGVAAQSKERVLHVHDLNINVSLHDLTITGGNAFANDFGGNIYNQTKGGGMGSGLRLSDVTVSNGHARFGGGIRNSGLMFIEHSVVNNNKVTKQSAGGGIDNTGELTLVNSTVMDNVSGEFGGGISNTGKLVVTQSNIVGNTALDGGGIYSNSGDQYDIQYSTIQDNAAGKGGGLYLGGDAGSVLHSAILNNTATGKGGGIFSNANNFIRFSTLSGNKAVEGGAVYANGNNGILDLVTIAHNTGGGGVYNNNPQQSITIEASILAANEGGNCLGDLTVFNTFGDNLEDATGCNFDPQKNLVNTDPKLGPLADNGGPTQTHALLPGSPAIDRMNFEDKGFCKNAPDQRGYPRGYPPADPNDEKTFLCDIGAFELHAPYVVNSTTDGVDADVKDGICETAAGNGICTLRAAIQQANAVKGLEEISLPAGAYSLTLAGAGEDASATGDLDIKEPLTINGEGAAVSVVDAGQLDRAFDLFSGTLPLTPAANPSQIIFKGITIKNGSADIGGGVRLFQTKSTNNVLLEQTHVTDNQASGDGGGIQCDCLLKVVESQIANNISDANGGGIYQADSGGFIGSVKIERSTISNNQAGSGGGGLNVEHAKISNSTFSGNEAAVAANALAPGGAIFASQAVIESSSIVSNQTRVSINEGGGISLGLLSVIRNSILAGNRHRNAIDNCSTSTNFVSFGHNLSDTDASDCPFNHPTDLTGTDPLLDPLADNGGVTLTHALQTGSPAIDTGDTANCSPLDQRGFMRPEDGDNNGTSECDIGAFELAAASTGGGGGGSGGGGSGGGGSGGGAGGGGSSGGGGGGATGVMLILLLTLPGLIRRRKPI